MKRRPDIVLFSPAPRSGFQPHRRIELPLGLLCAATPLDRQGYTVKIIDEFADPNWKEALRDALAERPLCFGVTCMTGPQILHALAGCAFVRQRWPDVPIVWGGIHASLLPEQTLGSPYVDIVVIGEAEYTLPELVSTLESRGSLSNVAGICYKENGMIFRNVERPFTDMDKQPPLSYHLVNMDHYKRRIFGGVYVSVNSSRGCTFGCKFCWDPVIHKRKWRAMGAERVLDHLKRIVRDYDIRGFLFTDDNFFVDMDRAYQILEGVVRANLDISLGKLQIRADMICKMDRDFLDLLVKARVRRLMIGVESGSPRVLKLINKNLSPEKVVEANCRLIGYPIIPHYLFMMGLPTETPEEFAQSVRLAIQLTDESPRAIKTFNIYTPYPGTELYKLVVSLGLEEPKLLEDWASFNFRNIAKESPWIVPGTKKLVEGLDFPLMFLEKGKFISSFKKTNPLVVTLARLYRPLARYRVTHMNAKFPLETRIVKALGFFGKQD